MFAALAFILAQPLGTSTSGQESPLSEAPPPAAVAPPPAAVAPPPAAVAPPPAAVAPPPAAGAPPTSDAAEGRDVPAPCRPPCGADDTCVNGRCVREGSQREREGESERTPPASSRYSAASETGFSVGLRVGYAKPLGEIESGVAMSDSASAVVPIVIDLGYRFTPNVYFGLYAEAGPLLITERTCPQSASCSGGVGRFGLNVHYRFNPLGPIDPWVGVGIGYEVMSRTASAGVPETASGIEFANLQLGLDFLATPSLRIGPYGRVSAAQYSSSIRTSRGQPTAIEDKALHSWLELGLRVAWDAS